MKYSVENHEVYHGNAIDCLDQIEDGSVDLIFADPPYNIGKKFGDFVDCWPSYEAYADWCSEWLSKSIKKLKHSGSLYVMSSTQAMPYIDIFLRKKMCILSRIVWHYDSSGMQAKKHYGSMYEPILHCVMNRSNYTFNAQSILVEAKTGAVRKLIDYRKPVPVPYNTSKVPGNVWEFPRVRYRMDEYEEHPSQKPEKLLERIILASSNPGDKILDPFAGTFTASAVAKRLGRKSVAFESERQYIEIGLRRVLNFQSIDGKTLSKASRTFSRRNTKVAE